MAARPASPCNTRSATTTHPAPGFIGRRRSAADRLRGAAEASWPWLRRIDRWIRPRLAWLTHGRAARLAIVVVIIIMTLTLYPLDLVPWGAAAPTVGILSLSLALMSGGGCLALFGYAMVAATVLTGLLIS